MSDEQQMLARVRSAVAQAFAPLAAEIRALTEELRELNGWRARSQTAQSLMLTATQAAERLAVSKGSVYNLIRTGKLKTIRIGRLPRIRESDLAAFIENRDTPG